MKRKMFIYIYLQINRKFHGTIIMLHSRFSKICCPLYFSKALHAPMEWAQRKDKLYLTIDVDDVVEPQIELSETTLTFR